MSAEQKLYVTQPLVPPLEEFLPYLTEIWKSKILTNNGPFHQQLEKALADLLGVDHIALFANGTLALVTALQCLRVTGEVITTPYSFVASSHSLLWNGLKPVFVDIDPDTFNLDAGQIEAAITPLTLAIMPVHCYGTPCAVDSIQQIADNYGLKVIYDAAHSFRVEDQGGSILRYGDLSVLSFHATKVYNTFEGGAIVCPDAKTKQRIDYLKNFGFADETVVVAPGINGKMNEIQAAFGLLQLRYVDNAIAARKKIDTYYRNALSDIKGVRLRKLAPGIKHNYPYFPIFIDSRFPLRRDELYGKFRENDIYVRRYFFPLISDFPMYRGLPSAAKTNLPVARQVSDQVLCLPIYPAMQDSDADKIIAIIQRNA